MVTRIGFFFFILIQFCCTVTDAQQTDSIRIRDTIKYKLVIASTGSFNQSNTANTLLLNNALRLNATSHLFSANFIGGYIYGLNYRQLTNNDVNLAMDGNFYQQHSKFFYWLLVTYTSSYSLKIKGLFQSGAGAAYDFIKTPDNRLNLSDGVLYEKDNLYLNGVYDRYSTFRNSLRLAFKWTIINKVVFEGSNFLQNSFTNKDDYIIRSNLALIVRLNKWLNLTSAFLYNRFNRTGQQNMLLTYGLRIEEDF